MKLKIKIKWGRVMFKKPGLVVNKYFSTRGGDNSVSLQDAMLNPAANAGGLYVPEFIPELDLEYLKEKSNIIRYIDLAFNVLHIFGINMGNNELFTILKNYENWDDPENPAPVKTLENGLHVMELWHGPTRAFKDMALSIFPKFLGSIAAARNLNLLVMVATSGDTGPASNYGFANVDKIKSFCMYPEGGTSEVQKLQMITEDAENINVTGINGNFDDAQNALKEMLSSEEFKNALSEKGYQVSAANSVNFGRIVLQIVYHIWGYIELVKKGSIKFGDEITSVIPSGNFGNGLACYYAKMMGLPIKKIVLASNSNNVLTQFFMTGIYDLTNRELIKTNSPAMDILKSSNIERLLCHLYGQEITKELMNNLNKNKSFELSENEFSEFVNIFSADFATDTEVVYKISDVFMNNDYTIDPHTATAFVVMEKLGLSGHVLISSTAEWTKFQDTMIKTLDDEIITSLEKPKQIVELSAKKVNHTKVIPISEIKKEVLNFLI